MRRGGDEWDEVEVNLLGEFVFICNFISSAVFFWGWGE